ncbi:hypothetical protein [Pseudomonas vranovensis]|uniref:hypothetical protein n=1 Tax=Pseudomonas vranovensis TaxID=321661 RepID=UPI001608F018|nr:hypothetical protein [Pseudomonas vranovensis]
MSMENGIWLIVFGLLLIGVVVAHVLEQRRRCHYDEYRQQLRDRKAEVERQARKAL